MQKIVKLDTPEGPVLINPLFVTKITPIRNTCIVRTADGQTEQVIGQYEKVARKLGFEVVLLG